MIENGRRNVPHGMIGVVASADENYSKHLTVMLISLLKNTRNPQNVAIFCIDGGISENSKSAMTTEITKAKGNGVDFLQIDTSEFNALPTIKHVTSAAYYRIAIPELFTENIKKIIYLDCDIIVNEDIELLHSHDISNYHVGAVENISGHTYKTLGIPQNEYFNSGVLLINLKKWREDNIAESVIRFKRENPHKINSNDQCALNGVLHKSWKRLDLRWNHQKGLYRRGKQLNKYSKEEVANANLYPAIIHFIGKDKPWNPMRFHPLAYLYDLYLEETSMPPRPKATFYDKMTTYKKLSALKKLLRKIAWKLRYKKQKKLTNWIVSK